MRCLFEIDLKDYEGCTKVFRRPSARAVILKGDKIALVYATEEKYYKFPGGGIHEDEDKKEALIREVREETGLNVIPESIREYVSANTLIPYSQFPFITNFNALSSMRLMWK